LALCRTRTDWKHEFVAVLGVVVGSNGETLQTTQTRSGAPQQGTPTGRYEKTGLGALRAPESG